MSTVGLIRESPDESNDIGLDLHGQDLLIPTA